MTSKLSNQTLPGLTYLNMAIPQIKRILTLQDRNSFSPTYGSFHRRYWLDKTDDFPDALPQFGVLTLALVYKHNFPNNPYYGNPKILEWAIAGMDFWTIIQHKDGTFDEFYPFERGWAGPTAFTTYAIAEAYNILKEFIPDNLREKILNACFKAACSIGSRKEAGGILANHHAIAALAIWKTYELLNEPILIDAFEKTWETFMKYHNNDEGWSLEYDGVDPGYLSATVSFLAKIYQTNKSSEIFEVISKSVNFCSYFVYPNNFYGGSIGSRNTLHFYPHGFEILSKEIPIAGSISERMLTGLSEGKLVPPEVMADRYVFYRIPEFLQSYLDYQPKEINLPPLPFERNSFKKYFVKSSIYSEKISDHYIIANLSKGGVIKLFQTNNGKLIVNDCGLIGKLSNGQVATSQWIGDNYKKNIHADGWEVSGEMKFIPSNKYFTPFKTIIFRIILLALGWNTSLAHIIKGTIRKLLMLKAKDAPIHFRRHFKIDATKIVLTDQVQLTENVSCSKLSIGDEFFVRYVPQSRYFQSQELQIAAITLPQNQLNNLNQGRKIIIKREVSLNKITPLKVSFKSLMEIK